MSVLTNKCILLFLTLPVLFGGQTDAVIIAGFLAAIIISSLSTYFEGNVRFCCAALHCTAALFVPALFPFLPLTAYDCFSQKKMWCRILPSLPLLCGIRNTDFETFFSCILLCVLGAVLALRTEQYEDLLREHYEMQDDATETALLLRKKNKELLKNQDYEVELATLEERNRIAREIHDNVGHLLTRSILQVSALLVIHGKDPALKEELGSVKNTLSDAMDNVRQSVHNLHEDNVDLKHQLLLLLEAFTFCPVELDFDCGPLPKQINYAVISIIKEALSNIARHSNASHGYISILEHPSLYQVIIRDNGTAQSPKKENGIGLSGMEERIRALNGIFTVSHGSGFRIFISIPKELPENRR